MRVTLKKFIFVVCVAVALCSWTQVGVADTIATVGGYGPYQTGSGGEFTFLVNDTPSTPDLISLLGGYAATTRDIVQRGTFQTFCLEENEYIYANTTYDVILNSKAMYGGVGPAGDPLSKGTAYLYWNFAKGTAPISNWPGYDYTNPGRSGGGSSAAALQNTIWWLEGEAGDPGAGNVFRQAVMAEFTNAAGAMADNNGLYGVSVLNIYALGHSGDQNYRRQDMLILNPVPEPATMLLLGSGLVGLAGLGRRKFRKQA